MAQSQSLARELCYAAGVAIKKKKENVISGQIPARQSLSCAAEGDRVDTARFVGKTVNLCLASRKYRPGGSSRTARI